MDGEDKRCIKELYVNLQEHFEKLWVEREKNIDFRFGSILSTMEATAKELAHRLEVLDHAHEQSIQDREDFLDSKEFKSFKAELDRWQLVVNNAITTFNTRYEFRINAATWISIVSLLVGVGGIVLMVLKSKGG